MGSGIDTQRLIAAWEAGQDAPPYSRALALLAAMPEDDPAALQALSIGARDRRLLILRQALLGETLTAITDCPACGERLETSIAVQGLYAPYAEDPLSSRMAHVDGMTVAYRLPTVADLVALDAASTSPAVRGAPEAPGDGPPTMARGGALALLERCVLSVEIDGETLRLYALPQEAQQALAIAIGELIAQADPQADIQLAMACAACGATWSAPFDPVGYVWAEVDTWVRRLLGEVHLLARAYGWSEGDILAMSQHRRRRYLEMVTA